jgi:MFS family permease
VLPQLCEAKLTLASAEHHPTTRRERLTEFFGLERNIIAVSGAMFLLALGENLWRRFLPRYLQAFGAPITAIGLFGTVEDLLDGVYQYPGGWIADRFGRRRALVLFTGLAAIGYAVFLGMNKWWMAFAGLALIMAWDAMASPTLFAVVGDSLPRSMRTMGFTVQSVLRRVPIMIAPVIGGAIVANRGIVDGVRLGLAISIVLAAATIAVSMRVRIPVIPDESPIGFRGVWKRMPQSLRWLLASDIFIRTCEGMVDVFLVIYALNVIRVTTLDFGVAVAVQSASAILVYIPAARIARRIGKKPFVVATFIMFSLFPLTVVWATSFACLLLAFVVGGLREIGEPARKAMIIDLAEPQLRARVVGVYYFCRSVAIAPAAFVGGLLWKVSPSLPFFVAAAFGFIGVIVFWLTVDERGVG